MTPSRPLWHSRLYPATARLTPLDYQVIRNVAPLLDPAAEFGHSGSGDGDSQD
jgi:hypothetical protein